MTAQHLSNIFDRAVADYHITDEIDAPMPTPYTDPFEANLYRKCWIDAMQWHMEDVIRIPTLDPVEGMSWKRRIDASNQLRTDLVEQIDTYYRNLYADVTPLPDAGINTESPAWAIDRLSILALKLYHMQVEAERPDITPERRADLLGRLDILRQQRTDLQQAIDTLLDDIAAGRKYMKVYRQMKLYNDPDTNPAVREAKK